MATNKKYLWAVVIFLVIPVILMAGGALFAVIDPEKLAGHTHYARNFQLLLLVRHGIMLAMFGTVVIAWFVTCLLLVGSKGRSYRWLFLALLGPFGLAILASLRDSTPQPADLYERFNRKLNIFFRAFYEIACFIVALNVAWEMMIIKREATISLQAAMTGVSRSQIIELQNASSGMYAFSELNEVMYFLVLLYLLRPVCVNVVGSLLHRV